MQTGSSETLIGLKSRIPCLSMEPNGRSVTMGSGKTDPSQSPISCLLPSALKVKKFGLRLLARGRGLNNCCCLLLNCTCRVCNVYTSQSGASRYCVFPKRTETIYIFYTFCKVLILLSYFIMEVLRKRIIIEIHMLNNTLLFVSTVLW